MAKKVAAPARPLALKGRQFKTAWWDASTGVWRDGEFWYDERAADAAVSFFHDHLRLTEGEWAGRPFILEGWQEHDIVRPLFGWKRVDGTRRFRRAFIWVARKNGKTELAAGIALLILLGDGELGGQVFSIASEKDQAALVFKKAGAMVAYSPTLAPLLECLKETIYCPQLNSSFRPLSGKPQGKHGLNMSGLVGDEIHEWRSGDLYQFVHDSAAARRQPLEILISTAGVKGTHGEEVYRECVSILEGEIDDPETLVVIYAPPDEADPFSPDTWAFANPNLGVSVKLESLAADARRAQQSPRLLNDFKRYRLNMWTEQSTVWLPIDALDDENRPFGWDHCAGPVDWRALEDQLVSRECYGGLDLASTTDLTAWVLWFPPASPGELPKVLARFFMPADRLTEAERRDRLPYRKWAETGALDLTPGNVTDYAWVKDRIYRDAERYKLRMAGVDRFNATQIVVEMIQEGLPLELFGQGFVSMSSPAKELERLTISNGFHHGGQPLLRAQAKAVAIDTDPAGNIKPTKAKASGRIDGIVSLVEAIGVAAKAEPAPVSVYESRGIRML